MKINTNPIFYRAMLVCFIAPLVIFVSCKRDDPTPKPRGYFRISLPEKHYSLVDTALPFKLEIPDYAGITERVEPQNTVSRKINIEFPDFEARLHLTYFHVQNDLPTYIDDAYNYVNKHISRASSISEKTYINETNRVYGSTYYLSGSGVASPYQFYLTDSSDHFLRGALYFNLAPNNDSLQPVIDFLISDIDYMINSLRWKE